MIHFATSGYPVPLGVMTPLAGLVLGAPRWLPAAVGLAVAFGGLLLWTYRGFRAAPPSMMAAAGLKFLAVLLLLVCLLQPLRSGERPRPRANLFPILVDTSLSMGSLDPATGVRRDEAAAKMLNPDAPWHVRLAQAFDVRLYGADASVGQLRDPSGITFDGTESSLASAIQIVAQRHEGRPVAGLMLITDGNATDAAETLDKVSVPFPVYPVVSFGGERPRDIRIREVGVNLSDFETAPVTIRTTVSANGYRDQTLITQLLSPDGNVLQQQSSRVVADDQPISVRFELRPESSGVRFYQIRSIAEAEQKAIGRAGSDWQNVATVEATLVNNWRTVAVHREGGPFRVLYLAGRPNWEFKFLRRALRQDAEVQLVGLIRMADKEPKFTFRDSAVSDTNPLFAGLAGGDEETREQYDEAVMLRLGVKESEELSAGFPETAEELFAYDAVILDDLESGFFTQDQMLLLRQFVSRRGGGLLMLGGQESFGGEAFTKTPLGDLSPVYASGRTPLAESTASGPVRRGPVRWALTREGLLQPWQRLRSTEAAESQRLASMPEFRVNHVVDGIKPGASTLATFGSGTAPPQPAVVTQRFGRGKTAALTLGDLWRWTMRAGDEQAEDPAQAWRQMTRWLVGQVPRRVAMTVHPEASGTLVRIRVEVRDAAYLPMDNADVQLTIQPPGQDDAAVNLRARPSQSEPGAYELTFTAPAAGGYQVVANVTAADPSFVGAARAGWVAHPGEAEYDRLTTNQDWLTRIANESGGEIVPPSQLNAFVDSLSTRRVPVTETWTYPMWHQGWVMMLAIACLVGEWTLRRFRGFA